MYTITINTIGQSKIGMYDILPGSGSVSFKPLTNNRFRVIVSGLVKRNQTSYVFKENHAGTVKAMIEGLVVKQGKTKSIAFTLYKRLNKGPLTFAERLSLAKKWWDDKESSKHRFDRDPFPGLAEIPRYVFG